MDIRASCRRVCLRLAGAFGIDLPALLCVDDD